MKGYGQFCPVAKAAEILTERWTPLVLRDLLTGSTRFNELRRGVALMSPSLLAKRLRELEAAEIVERVRTGPGKTEYRLTPAGRELEPIVRMMGEWGQRWVRSRLGRDELDVGLLVWDMRGRLDPSAFPPRRTVVELEFRDVPGAKKRWWFVNEPDEIDLCLEHPGYEVDLYLSTDLRTMTSVWMGDVPLERAISGGKLEVHGPTVLRRRLRAWLRLNAFAGVRPGRPARIRAAAPGGRGPRL